MEETKLRSCPVGRSVRFEVPLLLTLDEKVSFLPCAKLQLHAKNSYLTSPHLHSNGFPLRTVDDIEALFCSFLPLLLPHSLFSALQRCRTRITKRTWDSRIRITQIPMSLPRELLESLGKSTKECKKELIFTGSYLLLPRARVIAKTYASLTVGSRLDKSP